MSYTLRFVQRFQSSAALEFLKLEAEFKKLELRSPQLPQGKRYQRLLDGEPANILIWECEFTSLDDVQIALRKLEDDPLHSELLQKQLPYIVEASTEIYEVLDL